MDARRTTTLLLMALLFAGGCRALWEPEELGAPSELPSRPLSEDTVMLDIARVSLTSLDETKCQSIWEEIDEQALPLDKRRELMANGFRVGIIDFHLPAPIREIIGSKEDGNKGLNGEQMVRVDGDEKVAINRRRFPRGKRIEYVMVPTQPELSLLETVDGTLRGQTYYDAESKFVLKGYPQNDGRVQVVVTPEIHHGQPKKHVEAGEGMFRIETRKESKVLEQIEFSAILEPGQTLIISGTTEAKGLGKSFFERENGGKTRRQIMLLRLAGTQFDDLFQSRDTVKENFPLNEDSTDGVIPSHFDESTGD
ncbi:hypothetical protein AB1L30_18970 [Bremerella sp. JC817]|uniref:hypothetical protein n=1 Tax=Bremerella sp. JC817 TaxID=3231756 RepID=UPI00345A29B0